MAYKSIVAMVKPDLTDMVVNSAKEAGRFNEPGTGIAFVLAVEQTAGFESQLSTLR